MTLNHTPEQILARVDKPIAEASGLPNERYIFDESFAEDRDHIMTHTWVCIGFDDQLESQNFSVPVDFMGLPLLLTRDAQNVTRVFHNVCSHRGLHLSEEPCKNNGTIRCPYHSWTYKLDGTLHGTPHIGGFNIHTHPDFKPENNGLKEVRSARFLGAIFVNLSGNAVSFDEYIEPIRSRWSQYTSNSELDRFAISSDASKMSLTVQSNWKLAVENFLESYHLPSVHPELNRISPLDQHYCVEYFDNGGGQGSLNYNRLEIKGEKMNQLSDWPEEKINCAEYPALYPNTFFGIHADQLFILFLQPKSATETTEHVRLYYVDKTSENERHKEHRATTLKAWDGVFREDIFAVERMQKGRLSPAYTGGVFSPAMDEPTLHFHRWIARKLSEYTQ